MDDDDSNIILLTRRRLSCWWNRGEDPLPVRVAQHKIMLLPSLPRRISRKARIDSNDETMGICRRGFGQKDLTTLV